MQFIEKKIVHAERNELRWMRQGLSQTRTGYGKKLNTGIMLRLEGEKILRRVYAICYSNTSTIYILSKGKPLYFSTPSEIELETLLRV